MKCRLKAFINWNSYNVANVVCMIIEANFYAKKVWDIFEYDSKFKKFVGDRWKFAFQKHNIRSGTVFDKKQVDGFGDKWQRRIFFHLISKTCKYLAKKARFSARRLIYLKIISARKAFCSERKIYSIVGGEQHVLKIFAKTIRFSDNDWFLFLKCSWDTFTYTSASKQNVLFFSRPLPLCIHPIYYIIVAHYFSITRTP